MKIIPVNQSLILAGESPFLGAGSRLVAGGSAMPRVTVLLATRTDPSVVQSGSVEPSPGRALTQDLSTSSSARRSLLLYARTQRGLEDPRATALLDVFA